MVKKNRYGSFNLEISNSAQIPFRNCWTSSFFFFFFKSVKGMFTQFSERQTKPCSALHLLDGELCSSTQHVIIHDLVIPDERPVHQLALCIVITSQLLCSAGNSGQAGVWAEGTNICMQKPFQIYLNALNALWYIDKLTAHLVTPLQLSFSSCFIFLSSSV